MKKIIAGIIGTIATAGSLMFAELPDGLLHIYFLNVGQGDAILIQTPAGKRILVDGGAKQAVLRELNDVLPFFNSEIDYMVSTHPDRDHIEGLIYVMKRYRVKRVIFSGVNSPGYFSKKFLQTAQEKKIPIEAADAARDIETEDGVIFDVLFPFSQNIAETENTNAASIVAMLRYGENEILLTGDAEADTEKRLILAGADIDADVLKVGHHGSKNGTTEEFLHTVTPGISVISAGKGNPYHHPHPSLMKRLNEAGGKILRTDTQGRIELVFSKEKLLRAETEK